MAPEGQHCHPPSSSAGCAWLIRFHRGQTVQDPRVPLAKEAKGCSQPACLGIIDEVMPIITTHYTWAGSNRTA